MNEPQDHHAAQLLFLQDLLQENALLDNDVVEFSKDTWAIHGVIPYDGEVPMAVFDTYDEAKQVLDEVGGTTRPTSDA
jgi:hypothetical protein